MPQERRKHVAFLSFDWDYEIISEYYRGMQDYLCEVTDLQVVIFSAFGHYHVHNDEDPGARKVFLLCNPDRYDAFIVQGNRMWPPERRQAFVNRVHALGKPVVSLNYDLAHAHVVGTDNYDAMYGLIDRVLTDRGCTDVAYVHGLATSKEAQARAEAYYDACAAHGIDEPRFYQASWQIEDGRELAEQLLREGQAMPEVFFCCNDDIAIGIQEVLIEHGVRIPEDVMFAGFDNREIGRSFTPRVTTVDRDYHAAGMTAIDAVRRLLQGEELPHQLYSPVQYKLRESCRYEPEAESAAADSLISVENSLKRFYEVLNGFQTSVTDAESMVDILRACEYFAEHARCNNIYLSMSDSYLHRDAPQNLMSYSPISHLMAHRGSCPLPPCDARHIYAHYKADEVWPSIACSDAPLYVVYPLRHGLTCIGTVVTEGLSPTMSHGFLTFCLTLLSAGIANLRNVELLREANAQLDNLYVHDELTGLFNRFGFERFGGLAYEHMLRDFNEASIIFVDIDDMKDINDNYGHDAGDDAITTTAGIIRRAAVDENAFAMRYGGDEFLLIARRDLTEHLQEELARMKASTDKPYDLELSIGGVVSRTSGRRALDDAIQAADAKMYDVKRTRKAGR